MDNKWKRPYLERACKKKGNDSEPAENATDAVYLDPKLWSKLPQEVANMVVSYIPLLHVDWRWAKLLRSPAFVQMFGRGNNLNSSYGIVMLEDRKVPILMGFEQESQRWLSFPKKLHLLKKEMVISGSGSRDGLMLCESKRIACWVHKSTLCNCYATVQHTEVGIWNPLLCSFKVLPENAYLINNCSPFLSGTHYTVMVHEPSRTYRVFLLVLYMHLTTTFYSVYSVYDSTTGSWRSSKRVPDFFTEDFRTWKRVASCHRYIFLHSFRHDNLYNRQYFIHWYDADRDMWDRIFVSKILQELGFKEDNLRNPPFVENFVILNGVLYMLIRMVHTEERSGVVDQIAFFLASMDLSVLGGVECGAASSTRFKFEAFVPDGFQVPISYGIYNRVYSSARFNMYCFTMKGKGYIGLQTSKSGHFLYYNVPEGIWSKHDQLLHVEVGREDWETEQVFFHFKPSLVVP